MFKFVLAFLVVGFSSVFAMMPEDGSPMPSAPEGHCIIQERPN